MYVRAHVCDEGQSSASLWLSDQAMSVLVFETGSFTGLISSRLTLGQGAPRIHFYRLPQYWDYKNTWLFTWLLGGGVKLVLLLTWWLLKQGLGLASRARISLALEYLFYWNTEVFSWFLFKMFGEDTFRPPPQVIGIITLTPAIAVPTFSYAPGYKDCKARSQAHSTKAQAVWSCFAESSDFVVGSVLAEHGLLVPVSSPWTDSCLQWNSVEEECATCRSQEPLNNSPNPSMTSQWLRAMMANELRALGMKPWSRWSPASWQCWWMLLQVEGTLRLSLGELAAIRCYGDANSQTWCVSFLRS